MNRQEEILLSFKKLDYMTRKQIQKIHNLKSVRNANRVLKEMERYLNNFNDGKKVYYLNKKGRQLVDCNTVRNKPTTANHYLMRNDLYIHYNQPTTWKNEIRLSSGEGKNNITVVTDARFFHNDKYHIIEIDNLQKMNKNRLKIDKYRRLIERNSFKGTPVLIWVTTSIYRQKMLTELCEGLDVRVFLNTDIN